MRCFWRHFPSLCISGVLFACGSSGSGQAAPDAAHGDAKQPVGDVASAALDDAARLSDVGLPDQSPSGDVGKLADAALPDLPSSGDGAKGTDTAAPDSAAASGDAASVADDARTTADSALPDVLPAADAGRAAETAGCVQTAFTHLSPQELKTLLDGGEDPFLINVKGTSIKNIPGTDAVIANDAAGVEDFVKRDLCANIVLYCRSGGTSQSVGSQLVAAGYKHVRDLAGGITAWQEAGYPTM